MKIKRLLFELKRAKPYIIRNGIGQPFVYVVTPAILLTYYQVDKMQEALKNKWFAAYNLLDEYCFWVIVATFAFTWLGIAIKEIDERLRLQDAKDIAESALRNSAPAAVMAAIGVVVGTKDIRFGEQVHRVINDGVRLKAGEVFTTITQPGIQLSKLTEAVLYIFTDIARNEDPKMKLKVSLISIKENVLERFVHYHPSDKSPSIKIELLRDDRSCAMRALNNKIAIAPSYQDELKKKRQKRATQSYVTNPDRMQEEGSMFSYRIDHYWTNTPIYIMSVCSNKKGYFNKNDEGLYRNIMEEIQKRISVEQSLLILRDHVEQDKINDTQK